MMEALTSSLRKLWEEWDLRLMVLLSLSLQIILIFLGNRRKYRERLWITIVVWSAYLASDSVATFALGVISKNLAYMHGEDANDNDLTAFWAPFLLLHLGGPDTITAYALEDNELWLRHFLGLLIQTGVAVHVISMAWTGSYLSLLSLLMLLAGLIKYGERTWALRSASFDKLRENAMPIQVEVQLPNASSLSDKDMLLIAYRLQNRTQSFFIDSMLGSKGRHSYRRQTVFRSLSFKDAFQIVEIQLGFYYDLFYTKSPLLYTPWGLCLRLISFSLTCLVLLLFSLLTHYHKYKYSTVDVSITFTLLVVAVALEIYSALVILSSDRFAVWLASANQNKTCNLQFLTSFSLCKSPRPGPRWSNRMPQLSLISFCIKGKNLPCRSILKLLSLDERLEKQWCIGYKEVPTDLKELIFHFLKFKVQKERRTRFAAIPHSDGLKMDCYVSVGFRENVYKSSWLSILACHIFTEFAYCKHKEALRTRGLQQYCKLVNLISRYTLHLLINHPYMMSTDQSSQTAFQETVNHIRTLLGEAQVSSKKEACIELIAKFDSNDPAYQTSILHQVFNDREFRNMVESDKDLLQIWEGLGRFWLQFLMVAACRCKGNHHAQQLRRGGEFMTHVWLLMAHFGLTYHFQRSDPESTDSN